MHKICLDCSHANDEGAAYCAKCHTSLSKADTKCLVCGALNYYEFRRCHHCRTRRKDMVKASHEWKGARPEPKEEARKTEKASEEVVEATGAPAPSAEAHRRRPRPPRASASVFWVAIVAATLGGLGGAGASYLVAQEEITRVQGEVHDLQVELDELRSQPGREELSQRVQALEAEVTELTEQRERWRRNRHRRQARRAASERTDG